MEKDAANRCRFARSSSGMCGAGHQQDDQSRQRADDPCRHAPEAQRDPDRAQQHRLDMDPAAELADKPGNRPAQPDHDQRLAQARRHCQPGPAVPLPVQPEQRRRDHPYAQQIADPVDPGLGGRRRCRLTGPAANGPDPIAQGSEPATATAGASTMASPSGMGGGREAAPPRRERPADEADGKAVADRGVERAEQARSRTGSRIPPETICAVTSVRAMTGTMRSGSDHMTAKRRRRRETRG